jgi:diketogulonate reductase-like aldo/keto reductase
MHAVAANGARIPTIGFGTYGMTRPDMLRMIPAALLRWLVQQDNVVALSRTTNPERIVENLAVFDSGMLLDDIGTPLGDG